MERYWFLLYIQRKLILIKKCFIDQKKTKSCKHLFTLYITDPKNPYHNLLAPVIMNCRILDLFLTVYLHHKNHTMLVCRTTPCPLGHTSHRPPPRMSQRRELRVTPLQLPLFHTTQQCLESSSRFTALLQEQVLRDTTRPESPAFSLLFPPDGLQTI